MDHACFGIPHQTRIIGHADNRVTFAQFQHFHLQFPGIWQGHDKLAGKTFAPFLRATNDLGLAYVHVVDMGLEGLDTLAMIRENWSGAIIANNGLKADSASALLDEGRADAVSFGRAFIANPDLVERIRSGAELARPDYAKLYVGEAEGYTDYPSLAQAAGWTASGD